MDDQCLHLHYPLGLVEFEKCAILAELNKIGEALLGLVEFEKCAIFDGTGRLVKLTLGLVEFEKCAILRHYRTAGN